MDGNKMINTIEQFGRNAGRIWEMLDACGPLSESQLMEFTSLRPYEFYVAVGWLARENKIVKNDTVYRLDETNLTFEIGGNAGKIWNILHTQREAGIPDISRMTQIKMSDAYCALGWLARENKIQIRTAEENNIK